MSAKAGEEAEGWDMAAEAVDKDREAGTRGPETRDKAGPCLPIPRAALAGGQHGRWRVASKRVWGPGASTSLLLDPTSQEPPQPAGSSRQGGAETWTWQVPEGLTAPAEAAPRKP